MAEKAKSVYRVSDVADRTVVRVAAKSNAAARRFAASLLKVEKQSMSEVISATNNGYAIFDDESGTVINAREEDETNSAPTGAGSVSQADEE